MDGEPGQEEKMPGLGGAGRQRSSGSQARGQPSGPAACAGTWRPSPTPLAGPPPGREEHLT